LDPLATFFAIHVVESFLQPIKDQAIGTPNLAIGLQVSHRNILDLNGASFAEFPELV
jgi:hypothetical protein